MANDTFWNLLNSIVDKYIPREVPRGQVSSMRYNLGYVDKRGYDDLGYDPTKYGTNLTSNPQQYLHANKYLGGKELPTAKQLDYRVGADTDAWGNIRMNPSSSLNYQELSNLIHEMEHRRKFETGHLTFKGNPSRIQDRPSEEDETIFKSIRNRFSTLAESPLRRRERDAVSGQTDPQEIVAQLKAYEALLPAGMKLFQSPLGQKLFPDNKSKLWWLQQSDVGSGGVITDQDYLEGLAKAEQERKGKK